MFNLKNIKILLKFNIMIKNNIKKGQRIFIEVKSGLLKGIYFSSVKDIDKKGIYIDYPFGNNAVYLDMCYKLLVHISYIEKTGGGCKFIFSTQVSSVDFHYPRMLILSPPKKIDRIQRRRHVRIPCEKDCFFKTLNTPGMLSSMVEKNGYALNISSGGALLLSPEKLTPGTLLELAFSKNNRQIKLNSKIVRRQSSQNGEILNLYGLRFDKELENPRQLI
ncbi:MAG: hypothetical protein C0601_06565 [Candidatus Muiribacterium halophilum]|uniref:PilZ domain-containing protein n=1 Tax=Muiribacterium halophilum TaxID=2053465 RepID=A0A2N5ZG58_MUIH1|nr:MAG: hypothetical protein C0601_06565 [Candidatus Muirbacterium halophilum]